MNLFERRKSKEREIELSQRLGHIAKLGTENQHDTSSKHGYNLCVCVLLSDLSLLCEVSPTGFLPKYSGRGILDRGAGSSQSAVGGAS